MTNTKLKEIGFLPGRMEEVDEFVKRAQFERFGSKAVIENGEAGYEYFEASFVSFNNPEEAATEVRAVIDGFLASNPNWTAEEVIDFNSKNH